MTDTVPSAPALELADVAVRLDGRRVLDGVSLTVTPGERVAVVGPNGAGKTTLLRAALGLQSSTGTVRLFGEDVRRLSERRRAERVGYLPQERRVAWGLSARRVAALGAALKPPREADRDGEAALARVGIGPALMGRSVFAMSGGERARVLLARLLATGAPLLVADEPAAGLDPDAQLRVLDDLAEEARGGRAVVLTLHDLTLAARWADRVLILHEGRVAGEGPPIEALSTAVLADVFGLNGRWIATETGPVLSASRAG